MTAPVSDAPPPHPEFGDEEEHEPTEVPRNDERRFGRFDLCFELASGGMATVYLARASGPGGFEKLVALKRIHPHLAKQKKFVNMFLDEARIASRISHPNVCSVVDFGETNGTYYLAMDYLVGEPLSRALRALAKTDDADVKKRLPMIAARIISDAAEGLHAAHELRDSAGESLGVVHRDVSPHNVFVTYEGGVSIVDFGIATATDRTAQTRTGTVKGKYAYIAPEQVQSQKVDRRADVWSLGVVLWELLTQRRLFKRKNEAETLLAVTGGLIPAPSHVRPTIPEAFDGVVLKALSRDRDERYTTAREMSRDLLRVLAKAEEPVGMGDIAEFLHALFPGGEARKRQLLDLAAQPAERIPKVHGQEDSLSTAGSQASMVREVAGLRTGPLGWLLDARRLPWAIAAASLSILIVVLAFGVAGSDEEPPSRVGPSSATTTVMAIAAEAAPTTASQMTAEAEEAPPTMTAPTMAEPVAAVSSPEPAMVEPADDEPSEDDPATDETAMEETVETAMTATMVSRPRPRAPGTVNVSTPGGWAEVWFRGRKIGQSPGRVTLPAGRQRIELRPFGRTPGRTVSVNVPSGGTTRTSVSLR